MRYSFLLLVFICFSCQPKHDSPQTIELNRGWQFKKVGDTIWQSATVPGNVHSDLRDHNLIKEPFIGDNENDVQWISETDWEYKITFLLNELTLQKKNIEFNFEGLDTYASVYLNDRLIVEANNAFREWNVDVKPLLKPENELRLVFESTSKYEAVEKAKLPYELPEGNRIFTRKAQFQYGWDWGPKLNTVGIWRPIKLIAWTDFKIDELDIQQVTLNDSIADLTIEFGTLSNVELDKKLTYEVYVNQTLKSRSNYVFKGYSWVEKIQIENPKRWWPHNLGEPYLYDIKVIVKDENKILDSLSIKKGLRIIELVTEKDSSGESFYFKVNDVPVYAKGANYIPQHSLQNKVTDGDYEKLLNDVVDANMNMLRVWGGGIYENDIFYDLCDEKGILVWQDFMFACAMYPGDKDFLENVKQEAIDNVKRLRHHASIALWCGNNENSEGWRRWGWQADRSEEEKEEIWSNYLKVFDSILPNTIARLTDANYWETSPKYGRGNPKHNSEGDAHDWWIWHDGYPFEHLEENVPRFMSEFGFQSLPSYETIRYINQNDSIDISSEGFKNHQKHARGFQIMEDYMKRDFPVPDDSEDYVYMSQLLQAYGITKGIEAQRRAKPYNMGTLFWQLNDCWPAVSWSSIDYFGNWKALHYKAKKAFENVLVSNAYDRSQGILNTTLINDGLLAITDTLKIRVVDFDGNEYYRLNKLITVGKDHNQHSNLKLYEHDRATSRSRMVVSTFASTTRYFYFEKPKNLFLKQKPIESEIIKTDHGFNIKLSSTTLQKDVFLFTKESGHFSDNFFDLLPNETITIYFKTKVPTLDDLQLKSFNSFIR